jgi:hypothetical protein
MAPSGDARTPGRADTSGHQETNRNAAMTALLDTLPHRHDAARAPRFDMYGPVHKALRRFMGETLQCAGSLDPSDDAELADVLAQVEALMASMRSHLKHENDFLHAAIEARQPAGARQTAEDHVGHLETIAALESDVSALRAAPREQREMRASRLYRHLALFIAENLHHMHIEETANTALLWAHYTDAELVEIHDRLLANIAPADMMGWLRWFAVALGPNELAGMLGDMRAKAPAEAFGAVLQAVRRVKPLQQHPGEAT